MRQFPRIFFVAACLMAGCSSNAPSSGSGGAGQPGASGGSVGSGGSTGSGGSVGSGGSTGSGGSVGSGGSNATTGSGGTPASGSGGTGTSGTGGAASGGNTGSGGDTGTTASGGSSGAPGSGGREGGSAGKNGSGGAGGTAGSTAAGGAGGSGAAGSGGNDRPKRVLLYSYSTLSIGGIAMQLSDLETTLKGWGYEVDKVSDPMSGMIFSDTNLAKYAAVGMINTCFYPFGNNKNDTAAGIAESQALKKFLQAGGGLFGTHCAQVTFTSVASMPLYNQLLGGWAHSGKNSGDNADMTCTKSSTAHPTSDMLAASFSYKGNIDDTEVTKDATVLVSCKYGSSATAVPVSWVRTEGAGRVFNTSFGKVEADLKDASIGAKHITLGLGWVLGR